MLFVKITERDGMWAAALIFSDKARTATGDILAERSSSLKKEIKSMSDDLWSWARAMGIVKAPTKRKRP